MAELIHTEQGWRYKQEKEHLLRARWHDYQEPAIYMLTLTTQDRKRTLGRLCGSGEKAYIELSPLGKVISEEIENMPQYKGFEGAEIYKYIVMPDHIHVLLHVHEKLQHPLGYFVGWFKRQCTEKAQMMKAVGINPPSWTRESRTDAQDFTVKPVSQLVFATEYHDRILSHRGQLENMKRYIADNPLRLALKTANPDLFRIYQKIHIGSIPCTALGNIFLADYPQKAVVQCSRKLHQAEIDAQRTDCLSEAANGIVFVSVAISEGEKQICRALRETGYPLIILLEKGFPKPEDQNYKYFKPQGVYFEACAAGKLLLLEPAKEVYEQEEIEAKVETKIGEIPHESLRYRFLALNEIAERICNCGSAD